MQAKTGLFQKAIFGATLLLSLGLNAFFLSEGHYDVPDRNFIPQGLRDAYFVKRQVGEKIFVIEHLGHRYTVKCQKTLTWPDGIYTPAKSMGDGCTYIPSLVSKSIAEGLMREEGGALVYQPWEQDNTVQTADILTVIDDEKIK